jgi:endonuclease YncB( thermonuclease family)
MGVAARLRDDSPNTLDAWLKARRSWGVRVAGFDAPERGQPFSNLATLMLRAGLGCIDPGFEHEARDTDRHAARAALAHAQETRSGMWSQPDPMCEVDYRRATR